jgi:hypothetical protein
MVDVDCLAAAILKRLAVGAAGGLGGDGEGVGGLIAERRVVVGEGGLGR